MRISGGGRCNVTHACFDPQTLIKNYPRGARNLIGPFSAFQPKDTIEWFQTRNIPLKTEEDGRIFPVSNSSESIISCLLNEANKLGIEVRLESEVKKIEWIGPERLVLHFEKQLPFPCEKLLISAGGSIKAYALIESLGHTIIPPVPSLFTLDMDHPFLQDLAGISVKNVRVFFPDLDLQEIGPLLITHKGLSGPVILKISAWGARKLNSVHYQTDMEVNWAPNYTLEKAIFCLQKIKSDHPKKHLFSECPFSVPKNLWKRILQTASIDLDHSYAYLSKKEMQSILKELFSTKLTIQGKSTYKEEFVTCGGVKLDEIHFKTMESKIRKGVHFAGEILDIDGITGGFNFQNAWTTGYLAGKAMADAI